MSLAARDRQVESIEHGLSGTHSLRGKPLPCGSCPRSKFKIQLANPFFALSRSQGNRRCPKSHGEAKAGAPTRSGRGCAPHGLGSRFGSMTPNVLSNLYSCTPRRAQRTCCNNKATSTLMSILRPKQGAQQEAARHQTSGYISWRHVHL